MQGIMKWVKNVKEDIKAEPAGSFHGNHTRLDISTSTATRQEEIHPCYFWRANGSFSSKNYYEAGLQANLLINLSYTED